MTGTSMTFSGPKQSRGRSRGKPRSISLGGPMPQRTKEGVRVAGIAAAVRYLHTPTSVVSLEDCENMLILARRFLQAVAAME